MSNVEQAGRPPGAKEQDDKATGPSYDEPAPSESILRTQKEAEGTGSEPQILKTESHGVPTPLKRRGPRGTAAMDPATRKEVARKGGLAVSRNRQHMAEIGRKGGQSVSQNKEHMASIGRKGGEASRGHRG